MPLPEHLKKYPPKGYTGAAGADPSDDRVTEWIRSKPGNNIGLRMPRNVVGIDVDAYGEKAGERTLKEREAALGPLPTTWWSSSRQDGVSGIRMFRVPADRRWRSDFGTESGIEVVQWWHRYAVVWPSIHPEGRVYQWLYDGRELTGPPRPDELPTLPASWLDWLSGDTATGTSDYTDPDIDTLLRDGIPEGEQNRVLRDVLWKLARQGATQADALNIWQRIVDQSPLGRVHEPWLVSHFDASWESAVTKLGPPSLLTPLPVESQAALELVPLGAFLAEPHNPTRYRLDGLMPIGGRVVLAAQFKAGKTTLRDNFVRALADETPFLGEFDVTPLPAGRTIAILDNEMHRDQLRQWLADQNIINTDRVNVLVLRGREHEFNLLDADCRARWAAMLRSANTGVVIFDCLRAVLDALGLDENHDTGRFLTAFDALLSEAGGAEALMVHHMGHSGDRARGDSRIRDWPDAEWRLLRKGRPGAEPDPSDPRYFRAYGRDVDVPERGVVFDPFARHLTLSGGNHHDDALHAALTAVQAALAAEAGPMSKTGIERSLVGDYSQQVVRQAVSEGLRTGVLTSEKGAHRAILISLSVSPS